MVKVLEDLLLCQATEELLEEQRHASIPARVERPPTGLGTGGG